VCKLAHDNARHTSDGDAIEVDMLKLQLLRPEQVPAAYLGFHLRALITNRGDYPVGIRCAYLVGSKSRTRIQGVTAAPVSVEAGESVNRAITLI